MSKSEYDLYSWQQFDMWIYVLVPSGNVAWSDVAGAPRYNERDELKGALAALPRKAVVHWRTHCEGAPPGRLNRPLSVFQNELVEFAKQHDVQLELDG